MPTQLGGGIRNHRKHRAVDRSRGASGDPGHRRGEGAWPRQGGCKQWPGKIAVGIDARDGVVAVDGWTRQSTVRALDLALRFEDAGVATIIYTDIDRDGAMGGVNVDATVTAGPASHHAGDRLGGVSSLDDLRELRAQRGVRHRRRHRRPRAL